MRCLACDSILSPREATRKYGENQDYLDLCTDCAKEAGIDYIENPLVDDTPLSEVDYPEDEYDQSLGG